ncbi:MAG: hypothetical protein A2054_06090 [Deltaproteobacteria bacterium GWA2_55_10]|nr:MAG: hypothetical protein A2054_06090 [Deltaproteobacteria bacterium GWA2_55_10]
MQKMNRQSNIYARWSGPALCAFVAFLVYLPALQNGFVNWDDGLYITDNPQLRALDLAFIKWAFTTNAAANWHPLTWISYSIEYAFFGREPFVYHLTNVLLHSANTGLVYILSKKLADAAGIDGRKSIILAATAALLFGVHPVHVESVAWIAERKDVLYGLFILSCLIFYLKYCGSGLARNKSFYALSIISFILALMSKPMALTLPLVLLVLDYYPLKRINGLKHDITAVLTEKVPFFVLSAISAATTLMAQDDGGAMVSLDAVPLHLRVLVALKSYIFYLWKLVLPTGLAPFYPYPRVEEINGFEYIAAALVFAAVSAACLFLRRQKLLAAVWVYFVVTLLPVIGIVQVGTQSAADRYLYLPSLGFFILAGAAMSSVYAFSAERGRSASAKTAVGVFAALVLALLSVQTIKQERVWRDSAALWTHEINLYPALPKGYLYRASGFHAAGDYPAAISDLKAAISLNPSFAMAYNELGIIYGKMGRFDESIAEFGMAIKLDPDNSSAYNNRGFTHYRAGDYSRALGDFEKAVQYNPRNGGAYYNMGVAYAKIMDNANADVNFKKAKDLGVRNDSGAID